MTNEIRVDRRAVQLNAQIWTRRNSTIAIGVLDGRRVLTKTYRSDYHVSEEIDAYEALKPLVKRQRSIRLPEIISWSDANNSITLEFIDAHDATRSIQTTGISRLASYASELIELFLETRCRGLRFDADPSNFLMTSDGLVLVDPVCRPIEIHDFNFVVFACGTYKACLKCCSPTIGIAARRFIRTMAARYAEHGGGQPERDSLCMQMRQYLDLVSSWNRQTVPTESRWLRAKRRLILGPALSLCKTSVPILI